MSLVTLVCVLALLCFAATPSAKASTTYNIVLTPTLGTDAGTGAFTVTGTSLGGGVTAFPGASLTALNFSFDGGLINFGLSNDPAASVYFLDGVLSKIFYGATESSGSLSLGTGIPPLAYGFVDTNNGELSSAGTISLAPQPSTLLLWGTGLLALGAIFRKKVAVSQWRRLS